MKKYLTSLLSQVKNLRKWNKIKEIGSITLLSTLTIGILYLLVGVWPSHCDNQNLKKANLKANLTISKIFEEFDFNKDGSLDSGEITRYLNTKKLYYIFKQYDGNNDGKIDSLEYLEGLTRIYFKYYYHGDTAELIK
jgi:hypothetical protein